MSQLTTSIVRMIATMSVIELQELRRTLYSRLSFRLDFDGMHCSATHEVWLVGMDERTIQAIKGLRATTLQEGAVVPTLGLKDAKDIIDALRFEGKEYCVGKDLDIQDAEALRDTLNKESNSSLIVEIRSNV